MIAIRPDARSTALAFPNVRVTSPASTIARFASSTRLRSAASVIVQLGSSRGTGLSADRDELDAGDLGEVGDRIEPERCGEDGVV